MKSVLQNKGMLRGKTKKLIVEMQDEVSGRKKEICLLFEAKARVCSKVGNSQLTKARYLGVICDSLREIFSDGVSLKFACA